MRKAPAYMALLLWTISISGPAAGVLGKTDVPGNGWQERKGTHFVVYYTGAKSGGEKVLRAAERYYRKIAKNIDYERHRSVQRRSGARLDGTGRSARHGKFWLFENRCRIFIYPNREVFREFQPQAPEWSGGFADYEKREIVGFLDSENFLTNALPHEITHLILKDYLGASAGIPMWLDEGIALSQEESGRQHLEEMVWKSFQDRAFIPIHQLTSMRAALALDHSDVELFYAQAALLVDYLMKNSKRSEFVEFCKALRDGLQVDRALSRGYNGRFKSVMQLEKAFLSDLASQAGG